MKKIILLTTLLCSLAGCAVKGPLYFPEEAPAQPNQTQQAG